MLDSFIQSPLLLLFTVIAIGYGIGEVRVRGFKLGVAAVLFVGLGFGALDPDLSVPQFIIFLGLAIFVYTVGLSSAPAFFASFRRHGFKDVYFALFTVLLSAAMAFGIGKWLGFDASLTGGLYAGASTNTPALAGLLDAIQKGADAGAVEAFSKEAVVGYSLAYPMGVLGVMLALFLLQRALKIDYSVEARSLAKDYPLGEELTSRTFRVEHPDIIGQSLREFRRRHELKVAFGRIQHDGRTTLSSWETIPERDDLLVLVGTEEAISETAKSIGPAADGQLSHDRSVFDVRRLFISNDDIAGKTIASLNLQERFNVLVTRVQRGDMDLLATGDTTLELGDRVLLVAHRDEVPEIIKVFGNSYEALSKVNLLSFGLGITLGLLLGMINITLPGGYSFSLGFAGGPLIIALVLGQLRRTGPIVWTLPYGANLTLRQVGLIFLLAGIGIRSGQTFYQTLQTELGYQVFLAGGVIAILSTIATLLIGYRVLRIPFSFLGGMVGSQPAVLDFAIEQAGNKYPTIGYTRMLPVVLIGKILAVQILYNLMG
ncbi:aspartate:alanine exchanger family transporter [Neolewinella agarilytica]|uniref:Putative transport protein n=1 Tax=Neolewinella agarilytica TaxID=478744 RepID=A0A1H9E166_9BACT|nr:aspartate:alanine exchanger family transporter [Neolewinella agarilytica]SEQ19405.1 putative transport protein [Neolewinella agarilytica]